MQTLFAGYAALAPGANAEAAQGVDDGATAPAHLCADGDLGVAIALGVCVAAFVPVVPAAKRGPSVGGGQERDRSGARTVASTAALSLVVSATDREHELSRPQKLSGLIVIADVRQYVLTQLSGQALATGGARPSQPSNGISMHYTNRTATAIFSTFCIS
jgi:hypothetical protein